MRRAFLFVALVSMGCASITTDALQMISLTSDPPDAECLVKGPKGFSTRVATPKWFTVSKGGGDLSVVCTKGELVGNALIKQQVAGMTSGNILFGGLVGLAVDAGTGKLWEYPPVAKVVLYEKGKQPEEPQIIRWEDAPLDLEVQQTPVASSPPSTKPEMGGRTPHMTLEEQLQRLNDLKSEGKITEEQYASLRKRVIEGFPMTQGVVAKRGDLEALIGTWRGHDHNDRATTIRIFEARGKVRWSMTRGCGDWEVRASGTVGVSEEGIILSGTYEACLVSRGGWVYDTTIPSRVKIGFSAMREGRTLEGTGLGADNRAVTFSVRKVK